jgi:hypothetical protein
MSTSTGETAMRSAVKKHDRDILTRDIKAKKVRDADDEIYGERKIKVMCACSHGLYNEDEAVAEYVNIEENMMGEDVVTFKCALCDKEHSSRRFG